MDEAISSHIGGWFRNAATSARIHPIAQPQYEYELPESAESPFTFTATVAVQPKVELPDWTSLEVPRPDAEVPEELVDAEIDALRDSIAELSPVEGRAAREGDVVVVDVVSPSGEARRDMVVELGTGRMVDELEDALTGMSPGETKDVEHGLADGSTARLTVTLNEIKEKVLPPAGRRSRARRERVRHAGRAARRHRGAPAGSDLCRDRVRLPGRCRGHARPGVRRSALGPAGRLPRERAALRLPAHAREPRHLPGDLSHGVEPDARPAARPAARRGRALRRARARARRGGGAARHRGLRRGDRSRAARAGRVRRDRGRGDGLAAPRLDPRGPPASAGTRPRDRRGEADPARPRRRAREALDAGAGEGAARDNVMDPGAPGSKETE